MGPICIEVERKFGISSVDSTRSALAELGFVHAGTKEFVDTYYDTEHHCLTLRNCWLRNRGGRWQLKLPAGEKGGKLGHCTSYREVESEPDVVAALRPLLPAAAAHASAGAMVDDGLLRPLLRLHTARESWRGAEEGLVVDLDEADSGWRVGEVELLCDSHADVAAAQRTVEATCDRIVAAAGGGEGGQPPAEGKVSYLLRQRQPRHWERLVGAGVLAAPSSAAQDRG